jgi:hypothetical protein
MKNVPDQGQFRRRFFICSNITDHLMFYPQENLYLVFKYAQQHPILFHNESAM